MSAKVVVKEDCGNAPNKLLLRDFKTAFVNRNFETLSNFLTDKVTWLIMGNQKLEGIEPFKQYLKEKDKDKVTELELHHIITHGNSCAMNGTIKREDGTSYSFAEVYKLRGGKNPAIKEMTSYIPEVKDRP